MADVALPAGDAGSTLDFLTFRMGDNLYALSADSVSEVIRTPPVARIPQAPPCLLGVANLRGTVLPIASLRGLLGRDEVAASATSRSIILGGGAPVGLAVDAVEALVSVDAAAVETRQAELAAEPGETLVGAFLVGKTRAVAKILDIRGLLQAAFMPRERVKTGVATPTDLVSHETTAADDRQKLVSFDVAGQEFALALDVVREIVPAPETIVALPHSETLVLGMASYRDSLLPLLSLRGLLGLPAAAQRDGREKVIVTAVGGALVGLLADRMRDIVPADADLIEPTPAMLAARTGGEARIRAIYRGEGGQRLISILDPEQLFRRDVMARLGHADSTARPAQTPDETEAEDLLFLVFRLGDDEFGLPIAVVDEVARAPDQVTRLPKAPAFLEGVINLRGEVLPVVDQRRRFDMRPATETEGRRLIVVRTDRHRAGLIVDSVSEVLRSRADAIEPAPDMTGEATRLLHGVINLQEAGRLILLLDPAELLSRTERGLLDAFQTPEPAGA